MNTALVILLVAQTSTVRIDVEPTGAFNIWATHETSVGFTAQVIGFGGTGQFELDLGWTFHPIDEIVIINYLGLIFEGAGFTHAEGVAVGIFEYGAWFAEVWALPFVDIRDVSESFLYTRNFLTWHGFGPWMEGTYSATEQQTTVGGVLVHKLVDSTQAQLSAGADVATGSLSYRLSILHFF